MAIQIFEGGAAGRGLLPWLRDFCGLLWFCMSTLQIIWRKKFARYLAGTQAGLGHCVDLTL